MTGGRTEATTDADVEWCYRAVQGVSRTFAITIDELHEPTARHICLGYLLCRVADTVEDAGHIPPADQAALLRTYRDALDPDSGTDVEAFRREVEKWMPADGGNDWRVVAESPRIVATFERFDAGPRETLREPVLELVGGMAEFVDRYDDAGGLRIGTIEELEEYCWYAAGTVGDLITGLVSREASPDVERRLRANSRSFALLLQLVNVAKDVAVDYREENNVYLPAEWLREEGVDPEAVADVENAGAVARVVERVTGRASGYLDDAQAYLEVLPEARGNTLSAWAIPFMLAVATIRELRQRPEDVVREGGVKIDRQEVHAVIDRFHRGVSRDGLGEMRRSIERGPYHLQ